MFLSLDAWLVFIIGSVLLWSMWLVFIIGLVLLYCHVFCSLWELWLLWRSPVIYCLNPALLILLSFILIVWLLSDYWLICPTFSYFIPFHSLFILHVLSPVPVRRCYSSCVTLFRSFHNFKSCPVVSRPLFLASCAGESCIFSLGIVFVCFLSCFINY